MLVIWRFQFGRVWCEPSVSWLKYQRILNSHRPRRLFKDMIVSVSFLEQESIGERECWSLVRNFCEQPAKYYKCCATWWYERSFVNDLSIDLQNDNSIGWVEDKTMEQMEGKRQICDSFAVLVILSWQALDPSKVLLWSSSAKMIFLSVSSAYTDLQIQRPEN